MQKSSSYFRRAHSLAVAAMAMVLALPGAALAQSPWERAVATLADSFTGPIARGLTLVAIVMGGLVYAFDTGDSKRVMAGILFGGGMALGAAQFLVWLFQ